MYARINNGAINNYPVDIWREHPNVSFPIGWTGGLIEGQEYALVISTSRPETNHTQNTTEGTPVIDPNSGRWTQTWVVTQAPPEEIDARISARWASIREERNHKLYKSDWTQLTDSPLTAEKKSEWQVYRQELRDVTLQSNPFELTWPIIPA